MGELEGYDEVVALDTRAGHYRREVYRGGELVGSIVLGDPPATAATPDPLSAPATASRAARSSTAAPPTSRACAG